MSSEGFTTCLWFDGQAEEAAAHYVSVFKNSRLGRVTHYGEGARQPAGSVLTVEFVANGQQFVALNGGPEFKFTEAISFQILCADQDEIDYYWNSLTEGGEPGPCGWLKDRFGVSWQVVPAELVDMISDSDPQKVARATAAFMAMGKFDLAALRKAYAGE
ncbi:VOC family protein [Streptomyces sp. NPDC014892]|uniref:VOC family protein n=1 Tax=Streptomyces TaxID=1883 RepID=UPI001EFBA931|nr:MULTISPECIES: VOC family protein [Streptomyces]MEE1760274.1 VOC family protein [Streptomyces sp. SP18BB07]MEE1836367.1 VOC family protein [Streptomyces sp. SP17KL33]ULR48201.1 VOC family protein [Streptomyces deccanensis]